MNDLILIRGIPGSGKTTFCRNMFPNLLHLENDMFHYKTGTYCFNAKMMSSAVSWCLDSTRIAVSNGMDVVVSNTFTKRRYIDTYKSVADEFGANFFVYRMMGNFDNVHNVPHLVLEGMKEKFEDYEGELLVYPEENGEYTISDAKRNLP